MSPASCMTVPSPPGGTGILDSSTVPSKIGGRNPCSRMTVALPRGSFDADALLRAALRGERACGTFPMRIDRDGGWHYRGSPIGRMPLVRLFASVLRRAEDGSYWLVTPAEQGRIEVEDVPFTAVGMRHPRAGRGQGVLFRTHPHEGGPPAP